MSIEHLITEHLDIWTAADTEKKSGRGRGSANSGNVYGIKKLRELILELAVRGKLVPQDPNDEPASELLKRIQAEKAKLIAEGKIKKEKPLAPITEEEKPFELPVEWEWVQFGCLQFESYTGLDRGKNQQSDDLKYLYFKMNNILNYGGSDTSNMVRVDADYNEVNKFSLRNGDFLFNTRNSRELVGKTCVIKDLSEEIVLYNNNILRSQFSELIAPEFIDYWFRSSSGNHALDKIKSNTTNVCAIYQGNLFNFLCPVPLFNEQHRIVAKVDELMALCDQLENQHNNAAEAHEKLVAHLLGTLTQSQNAEDFNANWQRIAEHFDALFKTESSIDGLKQTLLQLAVMGKLVPQDPNDEPASKLLKRIQAEKAKLIAEGKIKKEKPLASITEEEKPFELPVGWEWVMFQKILSYKQGLQVGIEDQFLIKEVGSTRYLRITDFRNDEEIRYIKDSSQDVYCNEMDLLMIRYGGTAGEIVSGKKGIYHNNMFRIDYDKRLLVRKYLWNYFSLPSIRLELYGGSTSSTMPQISHKVMNSMKLPLPPIKEQNCIVAKVDELMAICDQLKTRITEANELQRKIADVVVENAI